ncbi:MAG: GNAT family N-acetyltransferase [Cytophagales bacterium]|nr:GNAT family N-acetyltransferase [Cytophagales bacterium]
MAIRKVEKQDIKQLKTVVDSSGLFPSEYLEGMMSDYLTNEATDDIWFTKKQNGEIVAIGYCTPEKFTEGTYNLLAIGVLKERQGQGIGIEMMNYIERILKEQSIRLLIVETSGTDEFELTRKFYLKLGYNLEATIRDFWTEGDDKVIFWKKLLP